MGSSCTSASSPRATSPLFMFLLQSRRGVRAAPASAEETLLIYATTGFNRRVLDCKNFLKEALLEDFSSLRFFHSSLV